MTYFKIDDTDFSQYVNQLKINKVANYNAQTNAAGNTVIDFINFKRSFEVGIIPLDAAAMKSIQAALNKFSVSISFLNPETGAIEGNVNCIIPQNGVEYYTIQADKTRFNGFNITFQEL